MKKITLFSILAAFVAALSFTSCNTDSDNGYSPLSKDAQSNFQMAMSVGSYNDMVVLFEKKNDDNVNNQTDSVASSVRISMTGDSTMSIANFPIAAIAEHISTLVFVPFHPLHIGVYDQNTQIEQLPQSLPQKLT